MANVLRPHCHVQLVQAEREAEAGFQAFGVAAEARDQNREAQNYAKGVATSAASPNTTGEQIVSRRSVFRVRPVLAFRS